MWAYSLRAVLKANQSKENILYILERGARIGCHYFPIGAPTEFASLEQAAEVLLGQDESKARKINLNIADRVFYLAVEPSDVFLIITFGNFKYAHVIIATNMFLKLIKDFALERIDTGIE